MRPYGGDALNFTATKGDTTMANLSKATLQGADLSDTYSNDRIDEVNICI